MSTERARGLDTGEVHEAVAHLAADLGLTPADSGDPYVMGWIGWGGASRQVPVPHVVRRFYRDAGGKGVTITVNTDHYDSEPWDLGYSVAFRDKPFSRLVFAGAYGYVNGFPLRDILWFMLTRALPEFLRLPKRLRRALVMIGKAQ